jgi:rod shape-determining protein MreC
MLVRQELGGMVFYHRNLVQNQRLTRETDLLKQKLSAAKEIYLENQRLKELLAFKKQAPYRLVSCRVIGRSADNWSSVVIIDKGANNGIKRGMIAITYLGLLGRVAEVSGGTAKITLINDPSFAISSLVQRSRQEGLVSGTLGGSLMMRYLPHDADIKVTDIILTSGLSGACPKGLIIGTVVDTQEEFPGLSRYALIKPAVNLSSAEEALVIIE